MTPTLFIDRDGTLVEEPADEQVDRLDKIRLVPGAISALSALQDAGYRLVMVTNQDGLGTISFPAADFQRVQDFILALFAAEGVQFDAVLVCPHHAIDGCDCRKPKTLLVDQYLATRPMDPARSAVIGDRATDLELAARLGIAGL
ncbi:MAG: histidinol-phosphatase, partial [Proteobacteria bacterium]|nr:histidinol-phosphatase [Pseudomonadota bacterium]